MTNKLGDLPLLLPRHRRAEGAYSSSRHYERRYVGKNRADLPIVAPG